MSLYVYADARVIRVNHGEIDRGALWPEVRRHVELTAARAQVAIRGEAPVGITGRVAASIRKNPGRAVGLNYEVDIVAGVPGVTNYLGFIIYGTIAHEIRPKRNRPNPHLRFVQNGQIVFRKRVWHPGTSPNDFMTRGMRAALP